MNSPYSRACLCLGGVVLLLLAACGDAPQGTPAVEQLAPGSMRTESVPLSDPIHRRRGTVWRYVYRLPEGTPERVKLTWRVLLYESGDASNPRVVGSPTWQQVPSQGTIMCAQKQAQGGATEYAIHLSDREGVWVSNTVPTAELTRHKVGDQEMSGGGAINSVAPTKIALDQDIPTIAHGVRMTEKGTEGHPRRTLAETLQAHDKVIVFVLRFTAD